MILYVYKSRAFKYLIYFFIGIILSGCYKQYLIKDFSSSDIDSASILKAYLKDGRAVDFTKSGDKNQFIKIDMKELVYKNQAGTIFTIPADELANVYYERFSPFNTILLILGSLVLALFVIIGISFGHIGSPGGPN